MLYRQMVVSSSSQVSNWVVLGRDKESPALLPPKKGTVPTKLTQGSGDAHMLLEVLWWGWNQTSNELLLQDMSSLFHNCKNPVKEPLLQLKSSLCHVYSIIRNCLSWEQPDLRPSQLLNLAHGQERESWRVLGCPKVVPLLSSGVT